ncbi:MAG: Vgb family protein [Candidatus Halalkalibacterium sp. M3_1C_030]
MVKSISIICTLAVLTAFISFDIEEIPTKIDVQIQEWQVPWEDTRPRDPYVAPDGDVWFVGQRGDYISEFNTETDEFRRIDLPDGAGPHNCIVDEEGFIWYAGNRAAHIGRVNPETGEIKQFPMPNERARDPHTLVFDNNGDIWFTVQGGNFVGKLTVETGDVKLIDVPTQRARPYGIKVDSNNRPWIALFGTHKLATVDPETMELTEIPLEREDARPRRLDLTGDGNIWYVDYAQGYLGEYDPESDSFEEWKLPEGSGSRPYAMVADANDNLWMVETGVSPNLFVGFNPESEEFFSSTAIESGGGTVRHMVFHKPTDSIWFGTDTNYLGQAKIQ